MLLMDLLWGAWVPPIPNRSWRHKIHCKGSKPVKSQVVAKVRIVMTLTNVWKTNKQIAFESGLQLCTVQQKTAKLFRSGKIDRLMRKENADTKPVCLYRKKE